MPYQLLSPLEAVSRPSGGGWQPHVLPGNQTEAMGILLLSQAGSGHCLSLEVPLWDSKSGGGVVMPSFVNLKQNHC